MHPSRGHDLHTIETLAAFFVGRDLKIVEAMSMETGARAGPPPDDGLVTKVLAPTLGVGEEDIAEPILRAMRSAEPSSSSFVLEDGRSVVLSILPWHEHDGRRDGALLTLQNLTPRRSFEGDAALLGQIARNLPQPVIVVTGEGYVRRWNAGAEDVYGYTAAEVVDRLLFLDLVEQSSRPDAMQLLRATRGGQHIEPSASRRVRKDGRIVDVLCQGVSVPRAGEGAVCLLEMDVTAQCLAARRKDFVVRELEHRFKNMLNAVQSIFDGSLRSAAGSPDRFVDTLRWRLQAFARLHETLTSQDWRGTTLRDIVAVVVAPFEPGRIETAGTGDVFVPSSTAVPLALTFYELASNALFHGSLSAPEGRVELTWTVDGNEIDISWREVGGPPVRSPERRGFGLDVIEGALPFGTGASVDLRFSPGGLQCRIQLVVK